MFPEAQVGPGETFTYCAVPPRLQGHGLVILIIATAILIGLCTARIAFPRRRRYPLPWARPRLILYYRVTTTVKTPSGR
jgi:hypothetical protein